MGNKIILVGYMGVGKSVIGAIIAKKLNLKHLDLDQIIEKKENLSIEELFDVNGELYFRKIEHKLLKDTIEREASFVLSTGGGTPCYYDNHNLIYKSDLKSIYLCASVDTICKRILNDKKIRPLIKDLNTQELNEFIGKHLFERSYYYQKARFKILVDDKEVSEICDEIINLLL